MEKEQMINEITSLRKKIEELRIKLKKYDEDEKKKRKKAVPPEVKEYAEQKGINIYAEITRWIRKECFYRYSYFPNGHAVKDAKRADALTDKEYQDYISVLKDVIDVIKKGEHPIDDNRTQLDKS